MSSTILQVFLATNLVIPLWKQNLSLMYRSHSEVIIWYLIWVILGLICQPLVWRGRDVLWSFGINIEWSSGYISHILSSQIFIVSACSHFEWYFNVILIMSHFAFKACSIPKGTESTSYSLWPAACYPEAQLQSVINSSYKCLNVRNCTVLCTTTM